MSLKTRNLKIIISYNGANYHGFQIQTNAVTIQAVIETALSKLLKQTIHINGCGRTDTGVHAREFCFNTHIDSTIPNDGLVKGLNALLPNDIAAHSCQDVEDDFHARYSAKAKEYVYLIHSPKSEIRDVFMQNLAYYYPRRQLRPLNLEKMNQSAQIFIGKHDFSAYCKAESLEAVKSKKYGTIREIYYFNINQNGDYVELIIQGNGFLHNMVRIMAGTLLCVSEDKLSLDDVRKSLSGTNRETAGVTLPPQGLYLNKVIY